MATATVPIRKLRVDSTLGVSLSRSSALPSFVRILLKVWLFPHVLDYIATSLAGKLGQLTPVEAGELYGPLYQFHLEVNDVLEKAAKRPWVEQKLMGWWIRRVNRQAEKLGDIVEALAWGSDPELREFIDESVAEIKTFHG
jgi:hypothetical protein